MSKAGWSVLMLSLGLMMAGCQPTGQGDTDAKLKPAPQSKIGADTSGRCTYDLIALYKGIREEARTLGFMKSLNLNEMEMMPQQQVLGRACYRLFKNNAETRCMAQIDYLEDEMEIHVANLKPICDPLLKPFAQSRAQAHMQADAQSENSNNFR